MLFGRLYDWAMRLAAHRHAPRYLAGLSFAESSFFPVPPDVMLIPMIAAQPERGYRYALITTLASVAGGLFGYLIGYLAFEAIEPWIRELGYGPRLDEVKTAFASWGVWFVLVAGFSPIPYKLFTVTAGALSLALLPFLLASFVGRGLRFFLEAVLIITLGPSMIPIVRRYIEWFGWILVILLVLAVLFVTLAQG